MFRYPRLAAALLAALCLPLAGCTGGTARSSGSTHAGMQTPSQDYAASAGNAMSGQMDNSIKGDYETDTPPAESGDSRPAPAQRTLTHGAQPAALPFAAPAVEASAADAAIIDVPIIDVPIIDEVPTAAAPITAAPTGGLEPAAAEPTAAAAPESSPPPDAAKAEDFLQLVNDAHRLPEGYVPPLAAVPGSEKQLHPAAAEALARMMAAAAAQGCPLHLVSGYRSVRYQQGLYDRKVQSYLDAGLAPADAQAEAARWVARPGASEHALGLAADLVTGDWYTAHSDLTAEFETTAAFAWLRQNAAAYGFILRYPAEIEAVTGVHYEPWHWRYVGAAAKEIAASGLCLEEWLAQKTP